ncbi:MAG: tRNA (adenosine(37)-N6)-dimethylallyltransferase MiaA [Candidatus Lightella neohaematopini]|nr:tRNA (adenosine(37)-N6)-dimethylallyltransferase MiaA [Candidatus Lightella neohaematopini]MCV2528984.1 tRNA (adenosine(37)-N6)-dimethylallyltransferase MiaA [Candidatus Lightella neohaematopini]
MINIIKKTNKYPYIILIMGPTASGKSKFAIKLRNYIPVDIISVDSMLIYRGMDIGTAKPSKKILSIIPHKLINIRDPNELYSVGDFYYDAINAINCILKNNRIPLLVGGSMFYFKTLINGLPLLPKSNLFLRKHINNLIKNFGIKLIRYLFNTVNSDITNNINDNDIQRLIRSIEVFLLSKKTIYELTNKQDLKKLPYNIYKFCLMPDNKFILNKRIKYRFYKMLSLGFENEVNTLFNNNKLLFNMPSSRCVGYKQMLSYIIGKISYQDMIKQSIISTQKVAKKQITWIKNSYNNIHWLNNSDYKKSIKDLIRIISY